MPFRETNAISFLKKEKKVSLKLESNLKTDRDSELRLKEPGCSTSYPLITADTEDRGCSGTSKVPAISVQSVTHTGSLSISFQGSRHGLRTQIACTIQGIQQGFSEGRGLL